MRLVVPALAIIAATLIPPAVAAQSLGGALDQLKALDGAKNVAVDVVENGRVGTYNCSGRNARIGGNHNHVTLADCAVITISGNDNGIVARNSNTLRLLGNHNDVKWAGARRPTVDNPGTANAISRR